MKKRMIVLIIALVFIIGGAAVGYYLLGMSEEQQLAGGSGGSAAPDFLIYDSEGNEVTMTDFEGKPVVLKLVRTMSKRDGRLRKSIPRTG